MKNLDIEKLNRDNFRAMMDVLSMPGTLQNIKPLFNSNLLALANTLLYSQVTFFYDGKEKFDLIQAINNCENKSLEEADYIFFDETNDYALNKAKIGIPKDPELSGTLIFKCKNFRQIEVRLSGPGINGSKKVFLPITRAFVNFFNEKNSSYPLGNEVFFLSDKGEIIALSRTTKLEIL